MTKEEIIQKGEKKFPPDIIEEIREDGSIVQTDVNATIRHAYIQGLIDNNCQLPSDIDEAAHKYAGSENPTCPCEKCLMKTFKTGAEWMAGQGFISEGIINQISGEDTIIELNEHIGYLEDCEEVIVNIRKKQ